MAEQGWLAAIVPEELGGLGLGVTDAAIIARSTGYAVYPEPFVAAGLMAPRLLVNADRPTEHRRRLASLVNGSCVATVAWQDERGGLTPQSSGIRVAPERAQFIAVRHKSFCSGTGRRRLSRVSDVAERVGNLLDRA